MASARVQGYLEGNGIGPLFEKLMASVIKEMPHDPISFLIDILQNKDVKQMTKVPLKGVARSWSAKSPHVSVGSTTNTLIKLPHKDQSSADSQKNKESPRDYPKPWQTSAHKSNKEDKERQSKARSPRSASSSRTSSPRSPVQADSHMRAKSATIVSPRLSSTSRISPRKVVVNEWKDGPLNPMSKIAKHSRPGVLITRNENVELIEDLSLAEERQPIAQIHSNSENMKPSTINAKKRKTTQHNRKSELKELLKSPSDLKKGKKIQKKNAMELLDECDLESKELGKRQEDNVSIQICATCAKIISGSSQVHGTFSKGLAFSDIGTNDSYSVYNQGQDAISQISRSDVRPFAYAESVGTAKGDNSIETIFCAEDQEHNQQSTNRSYYAQNIIDDESDKGSAVTDHSSMSRLSRDIKMTSAWGFKGDGSETDESEVR